MLKTKFLRSALPDGKKLLLSLKQRQTLWKESRKASGLDSDEEGDGGDGEEVERLDGLDDDWDFSTMRASFMSNQGGKTSTLAIVSPRRSSSITYTAPDLKGPNSSEKTPTASSSSPFNFEAASGGGSPFSFDIPNAQGAVKVRLLHETNVRAMRPLGGQSSSGLGNSPPLSTPAAAPDSGWSGDAGWQPWNSASNNNTSTGRDEVSRATDSPSSLHSSPSSSTPSTRLSAQNSPLSSSPPGMRRLTREVSPLSSTLRREHSRSHSRTHSRTHSRSSSRSFLSSTPSSSPIPLKTNSIYSSAGGDGGTSPTESVKTANSLSLEFENLKERDQDEFGPESSKFGVKVLEMEMQQTLSLLTQLLQKQL